MLRNFFKITFRNFRKNKSYVFINLLGLGLSLACCIVGYLNWKYAADYDKNHENHERIFKVHINKQVQNRNVPYGIAPLPLGDQIKEKIAGVTHSSRYAENGLVLKKDLNVFNRNVAFVEDDFFQMFTFPMKYGNSDAILDQSNILLSSNTAEVYFGDTDPTGELIMLIKEDGTQLSMTVGGVLEDIPTNSSLTFSGITHWDNYLKIRELDKNDWRQFIAATFVMTDGNNYPQNLLDNINENYVAIQNEARDDFQISSYYLEQLTNLGVNAMDIRSNWLNEPPPTPAVVTPLIMAGLMLLIACFNFTNTSIAISSKRLKEIGIRKVMGSDRKQLIFQFMGENLILSLGGLLVAVGIAYLLVPAYSAMWDFIDLELSFTTNPEIFGFLIGLLIFTSIIAGAYPSLYISSYQPVKILRGNLSLGGTNWFSKILLGFQYLFTIIALISSLAFGNNAKFQSEAEVGFQKDNILAVRVESQSEYEKYYNLVSQMPELDMVIGANHHIGWWTYSRTLKAADNEAEASMMDLSLDYKEMMDLKVLEGRYFDKDLADFDRENSILVNESMVKEMGWEEPVGKVVQIDDSTRLSVVGVMMDFYMYGFFDPVSPAAFRLGSKDNMNFVVMKSQLGNTEFRDLMEEKWYEIAPNTPFNSEFQDESLAGTDYVNNNIETMFRFLGILALILSSIGLYTLVSLNVIKRIKEIGVRKVLGASVQQIVVMVNHQFFWLLLVASVLGAGLSYFAIDALMASIFSVYLAASYFTVIVPLVGLLLMALLIASIRIANSAVQNPVKSLRSE